MSSRVTWVSMADLYGAQDKCPSRDIGQYMERRLRHVSVVRAKRLTGSRDILLVLMVCRMLNGKKFEVLFLSNNQEVIPYT